MENILFSHSNDLTILLEPTAACNLRCCHCYHAKTKYDDKKLSIEILDKFLSISAPYYSVMKIIWHGGEPLLMGHDFYVAAYKLFEHYSKRYKVKFKFNIQTNGVLLDEAYINLFEINDTKISVSYDGAYNDVLRQKTACVEQAIKLLQSKNVKFSCLSTVSAVSVNHLVEMYDYFKRLHVPVKFNPILPDGAAKENTSYILSKEQWVKGFIKLFENWLFDKNCNISVSSCSDILIKYLGLMHSGCLSGTCLFRYVSLDAYGNLYPCGRMMSKDNKLVNIGNIEDIRQAFLSDIYKKILSQNEYRANSCKTCLWFTRCHAGCNASAYLGGDLTKPFEFECYFIHNVFPYIKELLRNCDINMINKYAKEILVKC